MSRLAEAYFHLSPFEVSEKRVQQLGSEVSGIAAAAALKRFNPNCDIEVLLESGTLKGHVRVIGIIVALNATYDGIAKYKDFRESLPLLVADARDFAGEVIDETLEVAKAAPGQVFRVERRKKTPGKILKYLELREWLRTHRNQLSSAEISQERKAIAALEREVLADLNLEQQGVFERIIRDDDSPNVPRRSPPTDAIEARRKRLDRTEELPDLFVTQPSTTAVPLVRPSFHGRFRLGDWKR